MDIRQLQYFTEVARQKSFTKAADVLHVSQPSLSKMVKVLEDELGVTLIDRSARRIQLTDAGDIVYHQAENVLSSLRDLSNSLYDLMHIQKGRIKIGIPPIIGSLFFPHIMKSFRQTYPDISIRMIEFGAKRMERIVEEGEVDIGVVLLPVNEELFRTIPFAREKLQVALPKDHHLAQHKKIAFHELKDESFILFHEDFSMHEMIYRECVQAGFKPTIAYQSTQWDFIAEMVAASMGIALFPQSICQKLDRDQIQVVDLENSIPWDLAIIIRKDRYVSFATNAFIEHIKSVI
ncbi:LysR family transcriptional regulator [Priestia koreensis]|uniref:LysR family transcriptional regulator n=1 Tax=Priestia koreensis TaxID=284581 RepID=A0A0M0LHU7_9BACI|nr:LysR family transcriptional regulator [Priestia koreensis]KOO50546.1 LysR family transcriptional regulator [Priestia koreensis]MCM3003117.1 LysR family transcriptional regulator [Priestia koreensis]UNL85925.1 LysR family transcriptional regulator [Priestia koreensis]